MSTSSFETSDSLKKFFGNKTSGGIRLQIDANTGEDINIFSEPELFDAFMEFCIENNNVTNVVFLSELKALYEKKVKTKQEPNNDEFEMFYNRHIKAGGDNEVNIGTLGDNLGNVKSLDSFYPAAEEIKTLVTTNEISRFKTSIAYELYVLRAQKRKLSENFQHKDPTKEPGHLEKIKEINEKLKEKEATYLSELTRKRKEIFNSIAPSNKEQAEQKTEKNLSPETAKLEAIWALNKIKMIDLQLTKNESCILKITDPKKISSFRKNQKAEAAMIKSLESDLFNALLLERKQLLEEKTAILPSSTETDVPKETAEQLKANEAYIKNRFGNENRKSSKADNEKIRVFLKVLESEKPLSSQPTPIEKEIKKINASSPEKKSFMPTFNLQSKLSSASSSFSKLRESLRSRPDRLPDQENKPPTPPSSSSPPHQ